jgi:acetoin utilization protein AcuB
MTVADIMTKEVITIGMDDSLQAINNMFEKHRFHHVLVLENEELVGVISDRDVLRKISPFINTLSEDFRDLETLNTKAHQIMTRTPIAVDKNTDIGTAASIFLTKNVSCLPVVSPEGKVKGILSWKDVLNFCLHDVVRR